VNPHDAVTNTLQNVSKAMKNVKLTLNTEEVRFFFSACAIILLSLLFQERGLFEEVSWAMKHARIDPVSVVFVVCQDPLCDYCPKVPDSRRKLANHLYNEWNGYPIPLVPVNLPTGGYRYMCMNELQMLPVADRKKYQEKLPDAFNGENYQRCRFCYFYAIAGTDFQSHVHGAHYGKTVGECFSLGFVCLYRPPRPVDSENNPIGPAQPRCLASFASLMLLATHKELHGLTSKKLSRKRSSNPRNLAASNDSNLQTMPEKSAIDEKGMRHFHFSGSLIFLEDILIILNY
jgi:hypothetical protein